MGGGSLSQKDFDRKIEEDFIFYRGEALRWLQHLPDGQWFRDLVQEKAKKGKSIE